MISFLFRLHASGLTSRSVRRSLASSFTIPTRSAPSRFPAPFGMRGCPDEEVSRGARGE